MNSKRTNSRENGRSKPRKSFTSRPTTKERLCPVKLMIYEDHVHNVFYVKNLGKESKCYDSQRSGHIRLDPGQVKKVCTSLFDSVEISLSNPQCLLHAK